MKNSIQKANLERQISRVEILRRFSDSEHLLDHLNEMKNLDYDGNLSRNYECHANAYHQIFLLKDDYILNLKDNRDKSIQAFWGPGEKAMIGLTERKLAREDEV